MENHFFRAKNIESVRETCENYTIFAKVTPYPYPNGDAATIISAGEAGGTYLNTYLNDNNNGLRPFAGQGGVGIVRLSGLQALTIAQNRAQQLYVEVADNGGGIGEHVIEMIFVLVG